MNSYKAVFCRKSVRKYQMRSISPEVLDRIMSFCNNTDGFFSQMNFRIRLFAAGDKAVHTHHPLVVHAPYYLAFYAEHSEHYAMNAGYIMQQISLYIESLGLGTCFIGSPVIRRNFQSFEGLPYVILLAFGEAKEEPTRKAADARRLKLSDLCVYKEEPRQWMKQLLEAARLAPSSMNSQPWRFVVYDSRIHVFSKKHDVGGLAPMEELNFGIMFANMMIVAEEMWLDVDLIRLENISQKNFPNNRYVLSAILRT